MASAAPFYPDDFPLPDRDGYAIAVDMAVVRSDMAAGNVRQRRLWRNMPQMFSLSFKLHTDELARWQSWVNDNGYRWFYLPLTSLYAPLGMPLADGSAVGLVSLHLARFTEDLVITLEQYDWFTAAVTAELSPEMFLEAPRPTWLDRIDGLHPGDALADSLDGRFPADPAPGGPVDGGGPWMSPRRSLA